MELSTRWGTLAFGGHVTRGWSLLWKRFYLTDTFVVIVGRIQVEATWFHVSGCACKTCEFNRNLVAVCRDGDGLDEAE